MGGPAILKKKWGDLLFLGGPISDRVNLGGPARQVAEKHVYLNFVETRLSHLSIIYHYHGFCNQDLRPLLGFFSCSPIELSIEIAKST